MGEIELYKATPKGWSEKRSYLILKKVTSKLSSGRIIERYEVVKRWSAQSFGENGIFTETLKGVEYTKNELEKIKKIKKSIV